MLHYVVRDYFKAFNKKNIGSNFQTYYMVMYLTIVLSPGWFGIWNGGTFEEIVAWCGMILPIEFVFFSGGIHRIELPKMLYLCPMSREERKAYIQKSLYFRILFHLCIFFVGIIVLLCVFPFDGIALLGILCNDFLISFCFSANISFGAKLVARQEIHSVEQAKELSDVWKVLMIVVSMVFLVVWLYFLERENASMKAEGVVLGMMIGIQLPMFFQCRKHIKKEMRDAENWIERPGEE